MASKSGSKYLSFNPFIAKDSLKDSNQDPDINSISSLETCYLSPCEIDKSFQIFSEESYSVLHINI